MNSGDLSDRDRAILTHIGRHRISFQEIIGELFFDGRNPQKALNELRQAGLLRTAKGFAGNRSCYQLSRNGTKVAGVSPRRADALGSDALPSHIAILAFCFLKNRPRLRLEEPELKDLMSVVPPGAHHCVERSRKAKRVYHVYIPGDATPVDEVVRRTRAHVTAALEVPELEGWLANHVYSHAILVETDHRRGDISAAIELAEFDAGRPLRQVAHVHIERVPGLSTLEEALRVLA